ncbi:MAG: RecQ family ATP-dependent DNA helicase [Oscillospiraceae bacterium]|nr:RecQ family ATP-dependent DNA helicase [Oscillospiraceae bacterium]
MDKQEALKTYFGHSSFRDGQEALVDAILRGQDAFGIMPTSGGKSLCYQLPAVMMEGVAIIISPLISLMKDQVMALKNMGIAAAYINSSLSSEQMVTAYRNMQNGLYKIVYIAPERLMGEGFASILHDMKISLIAVDEAHCISQWGQDFRPSYLKIVDFIESLPQRPTLAAFTATATKQVREDIVRILKLQDPLSIVTGFDRPNLYYHVLKPNKKASTLRSLISSRRNKSGIVYCATRALVESVCDDLCDMGVPATRYHAGLSDEERRQNQDDFIHDHKSVMVATNAFGMGIDKSNVSFVIHYNMPKSLEAYYQEAGRAGRDGEKADCILMYSAGDINTAKFLIANPSDNNELNSDERRLVMEQDYKRLDTMVSYAKTTDCLRGYILDYFGQVHDFGYNNGQISYETEQQKLNDINQNELREQPHINGCGNCSNCQTEFQKVDITAQAQMILSCIKRASDKLGYTLGATLITQILCGSAEKRVISLGLDGLTTYGLMKGTNKALVRDYIEHLLSTGYLLTNNYGSLELSDISRNVLYNDEKVYMSQIKPYAADKYPSSKETQVSGILLDGDESQQNSTYSQPIEDTSLYEELRQLRYKLAQLENVPAYIVFSNASLADMARKAPRTMTEFLNVSGVGEVKASRYGKAFVDAINAFID